MHYTCFISKDEDSVAELVYCTMQEVIAHWASITRTYPTMYGYRYRLAVSISATFHADTTTDYSQGPEIALAALYARGQTALAKLTD